MKALSVILLNYNHAHWLRRSLRALAEQADETIEIIVVDDGSTDDSVAVIEQLARIHPAIRLLRHDRNKGVVAANNTGLESARGEFLFFAAADDLVLPGLLQSAIAALRARPEAALFCSGTVLIDTHDHIIGFRPVTPPRTTAGYVSPEDARRAIRKTDNWFIGSSVIYRRTYLEAVGGFDEKLGSLADGLANRLLAFEHGFYFDPKVLSAWRRYPDSYSARVALTPDASESSLDAARHWICARYPEDVRDRYASLFDRRYRYNLARLRLIWGNGRPDVRGLAQLLKLGAVDTAILKALSRIPVFNTKLLLAWITLRLRPFGYAALAAASWRAVTVNRQQRQTLQRILSAAPQDEGMSTSQGYALRAEA